MKKRVFSIFLILALLLAALAGCGQESGSSSGRDDDEEEEEQLLGKGWYEVSDEDGEIVGYLHVTGSKITVYDERGREEDTLRYDYSARKELYTLDDGELFGSEEFTVEKSRKKLTLITEDDDEYTLEEIDKDDLPGGRKETPAAESKPVEPAEPDSGCVELPTGCYAVYEDGSIVGYMKITDRTLTEYSLEGEPLEEVPYSYDRDGNCVLNPYDDYTFEWQFFYEDGDYYLETPMEYVLLEPIRESEIPDYRGGSGGTTGNVTDIYIGGNGSIGLYAYLPDELYDNLDTDEADNAFTAMAEYYDYDTETALIFSAVLSSGDNLEDAIEAAWADLGGTPYGSDSQMLFAYLRDYFLLDGLDNGYISGVYVGGDLDYDIVEDAMTVNGRNWRYCDVYITAYDGIAYISMMFWMDGDDMALVVIGGIVEDLDYSDYMYSTVLDIIYSLALDT